MSRVGKNSITIPEGVEINIESHSLTVKGPKGELTHSIPASLDVHLKDGQVAVICKGESKADKSLHGLLRMKIANMVQGVVTGYEKVLDIVGVGYRAQQKGKDLEFALGYSHPILFRCKDGVELAVDGQTKVIVKGINKELVGQMAADIRDLRPPEPYKGKGIKYTDEVIRKKAGKAGKVGKK